MTVADSRRAAVARVLDRWSWPRSIALAATLLATLTLGWAWSAPGPVRVACLVGYLWAAASCVGTPVSAGVLPLTGGRAVRVARWTTLAVLLLLPAAASLAGTGAGAAGVGVAAALFSIVTARMQRELAARTAAGGARVREPGAGGHGCGSCVGCPSGGADGDGEADRAQVLSALGAVAAMELGVLGACTGLPADRLEPVVAQLADEGRLAASRPLGRARGARWVALSTTERSECTRVAAGQG